MYKKNIFLNNFNNSYSYKKKQVIHPIKKWGDKIVVKKPLFITSYITSFILKKLK
jgi:hypothetical protein